MKIDCHRFIIESLLTSEEITIALSDIFEGVILDDIITDKKYDGYIDYYPQEKGFRTIFIFTLYRSANDLSHEELANVLAKRFRTRVVVSLADDHELKVDPYYEQMFDSNGQRYLITDKEFDDDEVNEGFTIDEIAPWPGLPIYPRDDDDDEDNEEDVK